MAEVIAKDTDEILGLIKKAQEGSSRSENKLVIIYSPYVDYMVNLYSMKTHIKCDDDLRAYINIGLLEGIRRFKFNMNSKFIYFAHIWMKKHIFLGAYEHRFIKLPANQQTLYSRQKKQSGILGEEKYLNTLSRAELSRFLEIENTAIVHFSDAITRDNPPYTTNIEEQVFLKASNKTSETYEENERKLTSEILKGNIKKALLNFNPKEVYIIEASFGLNGTEKISSEQIAMNLGVTKVNITFTKTRVIRMLRHKSFSDQILVGIE